MTNFGEMSGSPECNQITQTEIVNSLSSIFILSKGKTIRPNILLIFLVCGDVNPNPGPTGKAQCPHCFRTIAKNHRFVKCEKCV